MHSTMTYIFKITRSQFYKFLVPAAGCVLL